MGGAVRAALCGVFRLTPLEAERYVAKGPWLLLAAALAYGFLVTFPAWLRPHWPQVVAMFPSHWAMLAGGTVSVNVGVTLLFNLAMLPLYWGNVQLWRADASKPWPWHSPNPDTRAAFWEAVRTSAWLVTFNALGMALLSLGTIVKPAADFLGAFDASPATFPTTATLAWQLAVCLVVEDLLFYCAHRTLHEVKWLYQAVHKRHHEYRQVIALSSEHAHPFEYLIGNLIPVIAGPLLVRAHMYTLWAWVFLRVYVSIDEHCGYAFPWSPVRLLPFGATTEGHDYHHSNNLGVYASQFIWWDRIFGTDRPFHEWQAKRAAAAAAAASGAAAGTGAGGAKGASTPLESPAASDPGVSATPQSPAAAAPAPGARKRSAVSGGQRAA